MLSKQMNRFQSYTYNHQYESASEIDNIKLALITPSIRTHDPKLR